MSASVKVAITFYLFEFGWVLFSFDARDFYERPVLISGWMTLAYYLATYVTYFSLFLAYFTYFVLISLIFT
jgi:hypothetical protein